MRYLKQSLRKYGIVCTGLVLIWYVNACQTSSSVSKTTSVYNTVYEINKDLGQDSSFLKMILPYKEVIDKDLNRVIGVSAQRLAKGFPEGLLGNFIADILLNTINNKVGFQTDFCLINNGGLRAEMPEGPVMVRNIYEIMPFDNELVVLDITPAQFQKLKKYFVRGEKYAVSGIKLVLKNNMALISNINGQPFDSTKTYRMVTSDYLANGGSDMFFLKDSPSKKETGIKIRDAIIDQVEEMNKKGLTLNSKQDGRIRLE